MGELADRGRRLVAEDGPVRGPFPPMRERRHGDRAGRHERHAIPLRLRVIEPSVTPWLIAWIVHVSGPEGGRLLRQGIRQLEVGSEAAVVLVVILLDDDRPVRELGLRLCTVSPARGART